MNEGNAGLSDFMSDDPIQSLEEDILGHDRLAANIASAIKTKRGSRGFVFGIQGKWGSGKTSLLGFVERKLERDFLVFRYNPWLYPHENHVGNFFIDLSKLISSEPKSGKSAKTVANKLRIYATACNVPSGARIDVIKLAVSILALFGISNMPQMWPQMQPWAFLFLFLILVIVVFVPSLLNRLIRFYGARAEAGNRTLSELKSDLDKELKNLDKPILVIIDDLDRLPPKEICDIFQIVKNNGDLTNLIYILAYDENVVRVVLRNEYAEKYETFIEKIVQISFRVPQPEPMKLLSYFQREVGRALDNKCQSWRDYWEQARWDFYSYKYYPGLLSSVRDVKRVVNAVTLNLELVFNGDDIEVNPVDFVSMELIRVAFPEVYDFIVDNSWLFVPVPSVHEYWGNVDTSERTPPNTQQIWNDLLSKVDKTRRELLFNMIKDLFPSSSFSANNREGDEPLEWRQKLRIASSDVAPRYFIYGNYVGDISNRDCLNVLRNIARHEKVIEDLRPHYYEPYLFKLLEVLRVRSSEAIGRWATINDIVLFACNIGDYLPRFESNFGTSVWFTVSDFVKWMLDGTDIEMRSNILFDSVTRAKGIFGPVAVVAILDDDLARDLRVGKTGFVHEEKLRAMKMEVKRKALEWFAHDDALHHPHFLFVTAQLKKMCEDNEFVIALEKLIKDEANFREFLGKFLIKKETSESHHTNREYLYGFDFSALSNIGDIKKLYMRAVRTGWPAEELEENKMALWLFRTDFGRWVNSPQKPGLRKRQSIVI